MSIKPAGPIMKLIVATAGLVLVTCGVAAAQASTGAATWGPYPARIGCEMYLRMDKEQYTENHFSDCFEIPGEGWYYIIT